MRWEIASSKGRSSGGKPRISHRKELRLEDDSIVNFAGLAPGLAKRSGCDQAKQAGRASSRRDLGPGRDSSIRWSRRNRSAPSQIRASFRDKEVKPRMNTNGHE